MPLVVGGAAVALIFLTILTLFTVYLILTKWHDFVQGIPGVGGALANIAQYLRDRNAEIISDLSGVVHSVINWGINSVHDGFKALNDFFNAAILSQLPALGNGLGGL